MSVYKSIVKRYLRYRQHLVDDTIALVEAKAFRKRQQLADASKYDAWIGAIARNTALNAIRDDNKRNKGRVYPTEYKDWEICIAPEVTYRYEKEYEELAEKLQQLPAQRRRIFMAVEVSQIKMKELAKELGITYDTVKAHYLLARRQLGMKKQYKAIASGKAKRECLQCERYFISEGAHNRICCNCKCTDTYRSGLNQTLLYETGRRMGGKTKE